MNAVKMEGSPYSCTLAYESSFSFIQHGSCDLSTPLCTDMFASEGSGTLLLPDDPSAWFGTPASCMQVLSCAVKTILHQTEPPKAEMIHQCAAIHQAITDLHELTATSICLRARSKLACSAARMPKRRMRHWHLRPSALCGRLPPVPPSLLPSFLLSMMQ